MTGRLVTIDRATIRNSSGDSFVVKGLSLGRSDSDAHPGVSKLRLFEDGIELGAPHSVHVDIANRGGGRFSHWKDELAASIAKRIRSTWRSICVCCGMCAREPSSNSAPGMVAVRFGSPT